jgi:predicted PurR-regulated permease PerM
VSVPPARDLSLWIKRSAAAALAVLGIGLGAWFLFHARIALILTVLALLIAVALERPVRWLQGLGLPRALAIAAVMLLALGALAGVVLILVPPAAAQVGQLVQSGPALLEKVQHSEVYRFLDRHFSIGRLLSPRGSRLPDLGKLVNPAVAVAEAVLGGVVGLVTILFVVIFMLGSGRELVGSALGSARPENRDRYARVIGQLYRSLGGYVGGLLVIVLANATFAGVFLAIMGLPYFLPLAVLSGLASLVPYAGALTMGTLLALVAWADKGIWAAVGTVIYFTAYQQFENHVIAPMVYRRTVHLNPLVILLAVLFLTELAGIPGALVAVPLAATIQIVIQEILRERRERPPPGASADRSARSVTPTAPQAAGMAART